MITSQYSMAQIVHLLCDYVKENMANPSNIMFATVARVFQIL